MDESLSPLIESNFGSFSGKKLNGRLTDRQAHLTSRRALIVLRLSIVQHTEEPVCAVTMATRQSHAEENL